MRWSNHLYTFLALCSLQLFLFHGCFAQTYSDIWRSSSSSSQQMSSMSPLWQPWEGQQQQQQHRVRTMSDCRIEKITAREPNRNFRSEAGVTQFWDANSDEFVCAGVEAARHIIQPRGLILPYYTNAPQLIYIVQGKGIMGIALPGCPETFETTLSSSESESGESQRRRFLDRHQKVDRFKEGDVLVMPPGVSHWVYNDGDLPIVSIALQDTANYANQLDQNFRKFFIAGNPQQEHGEQGHPRRTVHDQETRRGQEIVAGNIMNGFDDEILSEVFNVDRETVMNMKGRNDRRGRIVRVENFQVVSPLWEEEEEEEERGTRARYREVYDNGMDETICSTRFRENLASPARANVYNPRGGRVSTLNSHKLPALNWIQLSAERGVLYRNAVLAPHWTMNAHTIIYITLGSSRLQIVGNNGRSVFDDEVREGQLIVVPQNFAVIKKAGNQGCQWVAFKTNDNAVTTPLAGRLSAIRATPEDVLVNSYQISREQAKSLKYNRKEGLVFSPSLRSPRRY